MSSRRTQDYTATQTGFRGPLRGPLPPWSNKEEIIARRLAAELAYRDRFGARSKLLHVLPRFEERTTPGYAIGPDRWWYYLAFPGNITVFVTVGELHDVTFDGWMFHSEVLKVTKDAPDPGTHIVYGTPHPMSTFNPEEAA